MHKLALLVACVGIGGLGFTATPMPAPAQSIHIGPGGVEVSPGRSHFRVDRREAAHIARRHGMDEIRDTDWHDGVWTVRGRDHRGNRMRVVISARSGRVIDIDRRHRRY